MREKYRWAAAVPGRPEQAKCSLDGKLISVRNGAIQLGQHEKQKIHIDAAAALPRQPSIRNSLVSAVDDDSGRLRATFYHVVRIALDGGSKKRELSETEKELAEAEKVLQNIKEKKERLQNEQRGINSRSDDISAKIVNVILK